MPSVCWHGVCRVGMLSSRRNSTRHSWLNEILKLKFTTVCTWRNTVCYSLLMVTYGVSGAIGKRELQLEQQNSNGYRPSMFSETSFTNGLFRIRQGKWEIKDDGRRWHNVYISLTSNSGTLQQLHPYGFLEQLMGSPIEFFSALRQISRAIKCEKIDVEILNVVQPVIERRHRKRRWVDEFCGGNVRLAWLSVHQEV